MRTREKLIMVTGLSLLLPFAAAAQSISEVRALSPEDRRAYMQSMSEEERTAKREQWRAEFDALPDDQKQAMRQERSEQRGRDREAMRERWESMSDEDRAAARDRRQARDSERRERWQSMSDADRAAARARRDERRREYGGQSGQRGQQRRHGR
jgi:hypothetical protein